MSTEEKELNRHDRILPPTTGNPKMRNKTIAELKLELAPFAILDSRRQYRLKELQQLATEKNIETQVVQIREKKGWEGKQKGLLHTLWERGWIDESNLDKYTMEISKDENGDNIEGSEQWSLKSHGFMPRLCRGVDSIAACRSSSWSYSSHHSKVPCRDGGRRNRIQLGCVQECIQKNATGF
jgi:hypothetical protein